MSIAQKIREKLNDADEKRATESAHDGTCQWDGGGHCCYPGNCSLSTKGGGPFMCRFHIRINDPVTGAQICEESKKHSNRVAYYGESDLPLPAKRFKPQQELPIAEAQREPGEEG